MTSPSFVRRVKANAEHLLGLVRAIEDREYRSLDTEWHNFLQAIEIGLEHTEALSETAELWAALTGFIESRGYFGTWQSVTRKAIDRLDAMPPELACRVANEAGFFLEKVKEFELALALHATAEKAAETSGNALERALAILGTGSVQATLRQYDEAEKNVTAALEMLDELDTARLHYSGGLTVLGIIASGRGEYNAAEAWFEQAARGYMNAGHHRKAVNSMSGVARARDQNGDYRGAIEILNAALDLLKPGIDHIVWTDVYLNIGTSHFHLGNYSQAKAAFLAIDQPYLEKNGLLPQLMITMNNLGNVALKEEEWEKARDYLKSSIRLAQSLGDGVNLGNSLGDLAETLLHLGKRNKARATIDEAIHVLEGYPENAWARKRLAAILAQRKDAFG